MGAVARGYLALLRDGRARRTYAYVLVNAIVHGGIYTWLGLYFTERFELSAAAIGVALLGYGIPGFLFGPVIGRLADRHGRSRLIPLGLATAALAAVLLAVPVPRVIAAASVALLSLGYDLTQPLLGGIVTQLPANRGQAIALNVFTLFVGTGLGALLFQALLAVTITTALVAFSAVATLAAAAATRLFAGERPNREDSARPLDLPFEGRSMMNRVSTAGELIWHYPQPERNPHMATTLVPERTKGCIDACNECVAACEACASQCISQAQQAMVDCIKLCLDCAELCATCVPLLARESRYYAKLCRFCTDACDACAAECEKYDDDYMRQCAEACRRAAESCRQMAGASKSGGGELG